MSKDKEIRTIANQLEVRATEGEGSEESRTITGYALKFNSRSETFSGGWSEIINPGALDDVMARGDDVRALFNHDPNLILARSTTGTLRLEVDNIGLRYEFEAPDTTFGNDLLVSIKRGDVNQSSFGFTVSQDGQEVRKEDGKTTRYINKISRLYDVSPVTYPAYSTTEATVRSIVGIEDEPEVEVADPIEKEIITRDRELHLLKLSL